MGASTQLRVQEVGARPRTPLSMAARARACTYVQACTDTGSLGGFWGDPRWVLEGPTRTDQLSNHPMGQRHAQRHGAPVTRARAPSMGTVPDWGTAVCLALLLPGSGTPAERGARPVGAERSGANARAGWK